MTQWWGKYKDVIKPEYYELIGYEDQCVMIRQFEKLCIPGLLQDSDYAHEWIGAFLKEERRSVIGELVKIRMRRQAILSDDTKRFQFLIHEAVLDLRVGDRMPWQRIALLEDSFLPSTEIRIIPHLAGIYPAFDYPSFMLMDLPDKRTLVHEETVTSSSNTFDVDKALRYRTIFDQTWEQALPIRDMMG